MNATNLEDKVMIVTGGAGGIGSCAVKVAVERGAKVAIADLSGEQAEALAHKICDAGGEAIGISVDLAKEEQIQTVVTKIADHFGCIDILINNAAALSPEMNAQDIDIETMPTAVWDQAFAVNTRGTMIMSRECLPHLVSSKGNIVNTVSNLALQGHLIQVAYASSKAALVQMTRSIAASHGRKGVRCNAVAPGMTMTPSLKAAMPEHVRKMVEDETLRDQLGDPEDIAEAIIWLASDAARNITGQILVADGGTYGHVPGFGPFFNMIQQGG